MNELSDEQIAYEEKFLQGVPRFNFAAFLLPPIWGPVHGLWATFLYYPIWLFADNTFYAAWSERTLLSIVIALVVLVSLAAGTVAFALVAQPIALHRAVDRGLTKEQYLRRQRVWTVVCVVLGALMLAGATYYNLDIRPTVSS